MPLNSLLPLRGITVKLGFIKDATTSFFHHYEIKPFLKELLEDKDLFDEENGLWVETFIKRQLTCPVGDN